MDEAVDVALRKRERAVAHWLLADSAVNRVRVGLLNPVENDGPGAEMEILVAGIGRARAPGFPATKRAANQAGISAAVCNRDARVVAVHCKFVVDQELRRREIGRASCRERG